MEASVNMETLSVILSVLFVSGALANCDMVSHLFITAPKTMEALSGSCLMIPCNFRTEPEDQSISTRTTSGVWIKTNHDFRLNLNNVVYNSSRTDNIYPMNITGDLSQRNCSTMFYNLTTTYTDKYYFRIENEPFRATAVCDPLQINVTDALVPTLTIPGDLREQQTVTVTCSALTPCPHFPPKLTWNLQPATYNHTEENTDGTFTTTIQETITLSEQHDGHNVSCSASYPVAGSVKTAQTVVTLSVSYGPKDTSASISPPGLVSAGSSVNLTCSSRAKPPVSSFTWFQISTDGAKNVSEGALYTFNATDGGVYYCVASNGIRNHTSPQVHLIIAATELSSPLGAVIGGIIGIILLLCVVIVAWWSRSKNQSPQTQALTGEGVKTEDETIHYGEITFSSLRPDPSTDSTHTGEEQQQDTVYAQVKVSERASRTTQAADDQDNLYAQVKVSERASRTTQATNDQDNLYAQVKVSERASRTTRAADDQDNLYAQVKVSERASRTTQAADDQDNLYAQVKR